MAKRLATIFALLLVALQFGWSATTNADTGVCSTVEVSRLDLPNSWRRSIRVVGPNAFIGSQYGLIIVDVSDPKTPEIKSDLTGAIKGFDIAGDYLYRVSGFGTGGYASGSVIDISDLENPTYVGSFSASNGGNGAGFNAIKVVGRYAYVPNGVAGLRIFDLSDPVAPTLVATYPATSSARYVQIVGNIAYLAEGYAGLKILNISNPLSPTLLGQIDPAGLGPSDSSRYVAVGGDIAFLSDRSSGLRLIDVSDPSSPVEVGIVAMGNTELATPVGDLVYVTTSDALGIHVIDFSDPSSPVLIGTMGDFDDDGINVEVVGDVVYSAGTASQGSFFDSQLILLTADPAAEPACVNKSPFSDFLGPTLPSDINRDGSVDILDSVLLRRQLAGLTEEPPRPAVTDLKLRRTDEDQLIETVESGEEFSLAGAGGSCFAIQIEVNPSTESVRYDWRPPGGGTANAYLWENNEPFCWASEQGWTFFPEIADCGCSSEMALIGSHRLVVTPCSVDVNFSNGETCAGNGGIEGLPTIVNFSLTP